MTGLEGDAHHDIAISGYGPVGATLAGLLGREGLRVGVFEKAAAIYAQPRAVGFDHDAMRLFQRVGVAEELAPHIAPFRNSEYFGAAGQVIQRVRHMPPPYPLTWAPNYTCDQPGVEAVLRGAVARMENVRVALGHEVAGVREQGERVAFDVIGPDGVCRPHSASFLVGCDGASSPVRRQLGIELESMDYDEPWIVVDLQVEEAFLGTLPATNVQYCEPERPCTHVVCPGNHRRWEFMMLDGEPNEGGNPDGALSEERLWRLLARWLKPGQARIWRAAAYRFHALVAREWRRGRVFLAGDSAHQTPPFLGQGMCQGLRDAGNLAWKLAAAVRGRPAEALLDSYTQERRPHVVATTRLAKELGVMISERDPARAQARDARMLAAGAAPTVIRQDMIPGLAGGLVAPGSAMAGQVFPQPVVLTGEGREILFDDLTGPCYRLVLAPACDAAALRERAEAQGVVVIVLGEEGVRERDGLLQRWFAAAGVQGALVRPDHYVFGTFASAKGAIELLDTLQIMEGTRNENQAPQPRPQPARRRLAGG
jgi:3-(3-hydroxy-phenyl)propionate hydroxylase